MTIRLLNLDGRAQLQVGDRAVDVERRSGGRFGADPMAATARWDELRSWGEGLEARADDPLLDEARLGPPVPRPSKVFGVGLNYRAHAEEARVAIPKRPLIFTKFPSCLSGPRGDVVLTSDRVDWEVELVVVMGRQARHIAEADALDFVAGYCAGQDISDRAVQWSDVPPQFSLAKSADGYGPLGPALASLDAFPDPNDVALCCDVNGERVQEGRSRDMVFAVPELVAFLSRYCTLFPGDLIFTGTPAGIGALRDPPRYLAKGDEIVTRVEGVGTLVNRCV